MARAPTARPDEDVEEMASEDRPVPVKRDYSHKPQKPITLKPSIADEQPDAVSWSRPPGEILGSSPEVVTTSPPEREPQPISETVAWTLHDISPDVRDEAVRVAKLEGIPVGEWVDRVLGDILFEPIPPQEIVGEYEEYEERYETSPEEEASEELTAESPLTAEEATHPEPQAAGTYAMQSQERPEVSQIDTDLQRVLQEIRDRLSALEQRRTLWDTIRGLIYGQ